MNDIEEEFEKVYGRRAINNIELDQFRSYYLTKKNIKKWYSYDRKNKETEGK